MENQIGQTSSRRSTRRSARTSDSINFENGSASLTNTYPALTAATHPKSSAPTPTGTSSSSKSGPSAPSRGPSQQDVTSRRKSLRSASVTAPTTPAGKGKADFNASTIDSATSYGADEADSSSAAFLRVASSRRTRARQSTTHSDQTSSAAASQRGNSPFSAPATPATAHSIATNVSSSAHSRGTVGKQQVQPHGELVASALAGLPSSDPLSNVKQSLVGEPGSSSGDKKGKGKAVAEKPAYSSAGSSSSRTLKRADSSPLQSSRAAKKAKHSQLDTADKRYSLRSRATMAPKTQASSAPGASRAKASTRKGRSSARGDTVASSNLRTGDATSSCARHSAMDLDEQHGLDGILHSVSAASEPKRAEGERSGDDIEQDTNIEEDDRAPQDHGEEQSNDEGGDEADHDDDEQSMEDDEDYEDEEDEAHYGDEEEDQNGAYGDGDAFEGHVLAMAGYMSGLAGRFRTLLSSIRNRKDATAQLVALQELSEVLSISNEDTLAGYFPTETFVAELIYLMGGPKPPRAVTVSSSSAAAYGSATKIKEDVDIDDEPAMTVEDNGEAMLLACRCLANLIEAMPYAAHSVVSHGAVPVLSSKLIEIEFIDLAEQVLQTMEKISNEYPSAIVREGGLTAMLQYLDFFNIHVQRTAMTAASNCCRRLSADSFDKAKDVMPIIQNVLSYSDQRLVESACRCIVRLIDSYRHHTELLEQLLTNEVVASINAILLPGSSSSTSNTTISATVYTDVLKGLGVAARVSPTVAVTLLENNIVETLYVLLTGSTAPSETGKGGDGPASGHTEGEAAVAVVNSDGAESVAIADVAVLQNLAQRPKEQVQEALSLVAELLPPLPRDGIFDQRQYTEKAFNRRKARQAKLASQQASVRRSSGHSSGASSTTAAIKGESPLGEAADPTAITTSTSSSSSSKPERVKSEHELSKERAQARRVSALREKQSLVKRFTKLVLPTLVEVYAASIGWSVRSKALYGILKIVSFVEPEPLLEALDTVPLASFVASVLSGRDHPMLVQGALQLVELLTSRLPNVYSALLRREGVMWEIEDIASKEPDSKPATETKDKSKADASDATMSTPSLIDRAIDGAASSQPVALPSSNLSRLLAAANAGAVGVGGVPGSPAAALAPSRSATALGGAQPINLATVGGHIMSAADAQTSNIWRARILREQLSPEASRASAGGADEAGRALDTIKGLVDALHDESANAEEHIQATLDQLAMLFGKQDSPMSSFELLRSGLVEGLFRFSVGATDALPRETRRAMVMQAFMRHEVDNTTPSAAASLIRRLQEALSRLENVELTTSIHTGDDSRRSPTANVARQIRLKLVAEGAQADEIPRSCNNIVVSIHAITSFQSLHDYLRPKIATSQALSGSSASTSAPGASSGLTHMLESLASSAGIEISAALRESLRTVAASSSATAERLADRAAAASGSASSANAHKAESSSRAEAGSSSTAEKDEKSSRRRSLRLSGKQPAGESADGESKESAGEKTVDADEADANDAIARRLVEGLLQGDMEGLEDDDVFSDDYDEEFVDDDGLGLSGAAAALTGVAGDETIQVDLTNDGEAKATTTSSAPGAAPESSLSRSAPTGLESASPSKSSVPSSSKISYASALQKRPIDWHLEFEMDGEKIGLESTIYSAIHRHEMRNRGPHSAAAMSRQVWANTYTIKFRKVSGPVPDSRQSSRETPEPSNKADDVNLPESVDSDAPYARILQLLRVMYSLNREWREASGWQASGADARASVALSESAFVNNKLTAKLSRQLEEPMIVASNCMPAWSLDLPRAFPFLFPFEARYAFLQSTSFGYHRLINRWQTLQSRNQDGARSASSSARHDDSLSLLGRLTRQKVRISRSNILASAFKVFELYGTNSSLLEVEYFDEVGTGLGPTLEFYAMVSREFAKKGTAMWRSDESRETGESEYVYSPNGLFPAPMSHDRADSVAGKARIKAFKILGQFVAKALFDSRIVDLNFSPVFMRAVLNERVHATLGTLQQVDEALAKSLGKLRSMSSDELDGLMLDFTLPGLSSYELHPGGKDEMVTSANVEQYIDEVVTHTLITGTKPFVRAFREGFDLIFSIASMSTFTSEELVMLFGNQEEDWSEPTLLASIKPDHGYNVDSATFRDVIAVMASFTPDERRAFLQWLTGSPKLPIGGFSGLHPQLTIVKRAPDSNMVADQTLPSVMTCVNFCKMPPFSTRAVMRERLLLAMHEGQACFHLS